MRHARVGNDALVDLDGVVFEVEEEPAHVNAVVLIGPLNYGLLEVAVELQHLPKEITPQSNETCVKMLSLMPLVCWEHIYEKNVPKMFFFVSKPHRT